MSIKVKKDGKWVTLAGVKGETGESAYEHAKKGGFLGTEEEFNKKLANAGNDPITIDDVPTNGSKNAVSSSGVYSAIEEVKNQIENIAPEDLSAYLTKEEANETFAVKGNYQEKLVEGETALFNITSSDIDGVVTVAYGNTLDLGNLKGQDGADGKDGEDGADGKDGADGVSSFTSFVFARSIDTPSTPEGGTFENPKPEGNTFSDSIPEGTDPVWMSKCAFYSNVDYSTNKAQWSDPVMMADTPEFEVIYSIDETAPEIPENFDDSVEWWDSANLAGWTDDPQGSPIWMATSKKSFGVWTTWTISKIKGEKGDTGSTTIYYANHNEELELGYVVPENVGSDLTVLTNAGWTTDFNAVFTNINPDNSKYYSMIVSIYYVDGNVGHCTLHEVESHTTTINQGRDGKMVYPAGLYSDFVKAYNDGSRTVDYKASSTSAPYVKDGDKYYIYNVENSWLEFIDSIYATAEEVPDSLTGVESYESYWIEMESFSATYAEILIADNGTVGDAVFNKGYMFSKDGLIWNSEVNNYVSSGNNDYQNFGKSINGEELAPYNTDSMFNPNTTLDFNTGKAVFGAGSISLANSSDSSIVGSGSSIFKTPIIVYNGNNSTKITGDGITSSAVGSNGITETNIDSSGYKFMTMSQSNEYNGIKIDHNGIYISEGGTMDIPLRDYIFQVLSDAANNPDNVVTTTTYSGINEENEGFADSKTMSVYNTSGELIKEIPLSNSITNPVYTFTSTSSIIVNDIMSFDYYIMLPYLETTKTWNVFSPNNTLEETRTVTNRIDISEVYSRSLVDSSLDPDKYAQVVLGGGRIEVQKLDSIDKYISIVVRYGTDYSPYNLTSILVDVRIWLGSNDAS